MSITEFLRKSILYLDGGMGTLLQQRGLPVGVLPEEWNLSHPEVIKDIHRAYFDAGSHVVSTNTFGASILKMSGETLEATVRAAIRNAREAAKESTAPQKKWVALDIGPTGRMLKPYGDLDFEEAVQAFAETVRLGEKYGADLIFIETMSDSYETKAALLAAKENSTLPVFVSCAYGEDGKLLTGASPAAMVALLEGMGADAIGVNCSLGPRALLDTVKEYLHFSSIPVLFKPNAGLPRDESGKTVYDVSPSAFADAMREALTLGVRAVGGCCGTTPDYIRATVNATRTLSPLPIREKSISLVSSYTHAVSLGDDPVLIGERINPTGKPRFKEALRSHDIDYILREGLSEEEKGVHLLDVNVGLPEIDEARLLGEVVCALQSVTALPLQIDTASPVAMETALRRYNGKAMINSVNGKSESLAAVLPLAKKYGGVVVALTLDEDGIPATAEGRLQIARRILKEAERYGIAKRDLIFDPLAMAVSADEGAARETLRAIRLIREELGANISLGVSNVSFGLPMRDTVNATFFALALSNGLNAAIMNPYSEQMMKCYHAYRALAGLDARGFAYIDYASRLSTPSEAPSVKHAGDTDSSYTLGEAIRRGMKGEATGITRALLQEKDALAIISDEIIPALDAVGKGFEEKTVYLPQLLMSAEAAGAAFEVIREAERRETVKDKCTVILATVKGDIHDIGKNIVRMLLENYGFRVVDLGRDVPAERIVSETLRYKAPLVGLSALMTTTVPAMEEAIRLLRREAPFARVMVGGAVLTEEYASAIGADAYGKDAMAAVRYAERVNGSL